MVAQKLPGPPPVPTDSTNSRQHRAQIAQSLNSLNRHVFEADGTIKQSVIDLTTTVTNQGTTLNAAVNAEATVRASADTTLATNLATVSTTVGTNTANITTLTSSLNGVKAQWGVSLDINGNVVGSIKLDGTASHSNFIVHANNFEIYDGSSASPAFQITGGVAYLNVPLKTNSVGNSNLQSGSVANTNLQSGSVANANIQGNAVATGNIIDNAVTDASVAIGSPTPITTPFGGAYTTLTSVTKSLSGGDVLLSFTDYITWSSNGPRGFYRIIDSNGHTFMTQGYGGGSCPDFITSAGSGLDTTGQGGTVTYYLQADWEAGNSPTSMIPALVVTELKK